MIKHSPPSTVHGSLSVVLATRNEEENVERCIRSVKGLADEIVVFDEYSTDKTAEIAQKLGAKVYLEPHHDIFHITKQKALEKANGEWILQLDADEVVTPALKEEIKSVLDGTHNMEVRPLFSRHQKLIEERDGKIGTETGEIVGYFIPRKNMFLGKPLVHAGVYPDGVIRLVKSGKASFPQKSVHEQIKLNGRVSWLSNDLEHYDSPTFKRYLARANRYTDLTAQEFARAGVSKSPVSFVYFSFIKPLSIFVSLYFRHLGILDGPQGFIWSFFSAMHFPLAYYKYIVTKNEK